MRPKRYVAQIPHSSMAFRPSNFHFTPLNETNLHANANSLNPTMGHDRGPEPAQLQPGEALVRVEAVGICGTDYGGYLGKMPFFSYPRIPGHELGVEVIGVGKDVTNIAVGDRCCVEPYINCQRCHSCCLGKTNCCEHHQTLGVHCDGGLRPQFIVPARSSTHLLICPRNKMRLLKPLPLVATQLIEPILGQRTPFSLLVPDRLAFLLWNLFVSPEPDSL